MEKTEKINVKRLSPKEQYLLRRSIIRMSEKGFKCGEIADALGVSTRVISLTRKNYKENGLDGIAMKHRGRKAGEKRNLTKEQEKEIREIIVDKTPEQLKLKCCLWTRKAIRDLIQQKYTINMPLSTLGYYLERWGFSVQRPIKKARNQDPEKIDKWLKEEYPAIEKKAKDEKAEIYWGDETGIQNTANYLRGYAPIGETPVVEVESKKMKLNLLSAVSNQGKLRFTISKESVNANTLIDFMRKLVHDAERKVFLILDNLRVHHAKKVSAWLEKHKDKIEIFFLPPYAPEYNPDEYFNSDLKRSVGNRPMPKDDIQLESYARSFLKFDQLRPERVKSYFLSKHVLYASNAISNI